jgi:hypothetical protein
MVDGLLVGDGHGVNGAHPEGFPQAEDVMTALQTEAKTLKLLSEHDEESGWDGPQLMCGPIVQTGPFDNVSSMPLTALGSDLSRFVPVSLSWSIGTHRAFPVAARQRAVEVLLIGAALARGWGAQRSTGDPLTALPIELWVAVVMGHVVHRRSKPGGVGEGCKRVHVF